MPARLSRCHRQAADPAARRPVRCSPARGWRSCRSRANWFRPRTSACVAGQHQRARRHRLRPDGPICPARAGIAAAAAEGRGGAGAHDHLAHAGRLRRQRRFQLGHLHHLPEGMGRARSNDRAKSRSRSTRCSRSSRRCAAMPRSDRRWGAGADSRSASCIAGSTYEGLVAARDRIIAAARNNPGIINLDSDYKETKPQLNDRGEHHARRRSRRVGRRRQPGAADAARFAPGLDLYRSRRGISRDRPGRGRRPHRPSPICNRSTSAAAPMRWCRCPAWSMSREVAGPRDLGRFNKLRAITLEGGIAPKAIRWVRR